MNSKYFLVAIFFLVSIFVIFMVSYNTDCGNDVDCWIHKMDSEAYNDRGLDLSKAKEIITDAPKEPSNISILNGKRGPIGAALIVSISLNERASAKQKKDLFDWAKENKDLIGFDIRKLEGTLSKETDKPSPSDNTPLEDEGK